MTLKLVTLILLTTFLPFTAIPAVSEDLYNGIGTYIARHPAVQASQAQISAAKTNKEMQYLFFLPFNASAKADLIVSTSGVEVSGQISLGYTLFDSGQLRSYKKTEYLIKASEASLEWIKQTILYNLLSVYLEVQTREERLEILKNRRDALNRSTDGSRKRFELGDMNQTDLNYALSRLTVAEAEYIKAVSDYNSALTKLDRITDIYDGMQAAVKIPEPVLPESTKGFKTLLENRSDIKQMNILIQAADNDIQGVNTLLPDGLELTTGGYNLFTSSPEFRFGIGIDIPIASIPYEEGREKSFIIEKNRLENNLADFTDGENLKLEQIAIRLNSEKVAEDLYYEALEYSRLAMEGIQTEHEAGYKSLFELLNAQNNYYNLAENLASVKSIYERTSLDYYYLTGGLDLEFINILR